MAKNCNSCGTTKKSQCDFIPKYTNDCSSCGDRPTYGMNECVYICRENGRGEQVRDIYKSLISDNDTHPSDGVLSVPPTWKAVSLCALLGMEATPPDGNTVPNGAACVDGFMVISLSDGTAITTEVPCVEDTIDPNTDTVPNGGSCVDGFVNISMSDGTSVVTQVPCVVDTDTVNPNAVLNITNPNDGDGIIVINVAPNDGTAPYDLTLPEPPLVETDGVHYSGAPTIAGTVVTFPTVNDIDESPATPITLDLAAFISPPDGPVTGEGDVTVTGNQADGYVVSYTDEDQVYNQGDNITFVTEADGSITISSALSVEDVYKKCDGEDLANGDTVLTPDSIEVRCLTRGIQITVCDEVYRFSPNRVQVGSFLEANAIEITAATPVGTVIGSEHASNISAVLCDSNITVNNNFTLKQSITGAVAGSSGDVRVRPQYQIDGGGWNNMTTGGADEFFIVEGQAFAGEIERNDFFDLPDLTAGLHTLEVRYVIEQNNLVGDARFTNGQTNFYQERIQMDCCHP